MEKDKLYENLIIIKRQQQIRFKFFGHVCNAGR